MHVRRICIWITSSFHEIPRGDYSQFLEIFRSIEIRFGHVVDVIITQSANGAKIQTENMIQLKIHRKHVLQEYTFTRTYSSWDNIF